MTTPLPPPFRQLSQYEFSQLSHARIHPLRSWQPEFLSDPKGSSQAANVFPSAASATFLSRCTSRSHRFALADQCSHTDQGAPLTLSIMTVLAAAHSRRCEVSSRLEYNLAFSRQRTPTKPQRWMWSSSLQWYRCYHANLES